MDGFLPKADENLMQWVLNDSKGFPYWHERSIYRRCLTCLLKETPTRTDPTSTSLKYPTRRA